MVGSLGQSTYHICFPPLCKPVRFLLYYTVGSESCYLLQVSITGCKSMKKSEGYLRDLSQTIANQIRADPFKCWVNAARALLQCQELEQARYVEGWLMTSDEPGLICAHGWIELPSEDVIDPTRVIGNHATLPGFPLRRKKQGHWGRCLKRSRMGGKD